MSLYSYFRISKPSAAKVPAEQIESTYKSLRNRTFWGATVAYSLYYVCRMTLSVVKQPLIDGGVLTAGQLGLIGSALLFVYALGKFTNGFIADYCNIRKFMAIGLFVSAAVNLVMGFLGVIGTLTGLATTLIFISFFVLWGVNGWVQSMGAPPGIINLSRWFPMSKRGTYYSIFSASPYFGKFLTFILTGVVVGALGWEWGFIFAAAAGVAGGIIVLYFVSDTPESKGLPSVQELSGEQPKKVDSMPTRELQKIVFKHPGIWIIALSSAFVYITQYAISGWGVLFLQKARGFSLPAATQIIASGRYRVRGMAFRHGVQGEQSETCCPVRNSLSHISDIVPVHPRRLHAEHCICFILQPVHRGAVLCRSRSHGCGYRSAKGYRCCTGYRGHFELCGCCSARYRERLPNPGRFGDFRFSTVFGCL